MIRKWWPVIAIATASSSPLMAENQGVWKVENLATSDRIVKERSLLSVGIWQMSMWQPIAFTRAQWQFVPSLASPRTSLRQSTAQSAGPSHVQRSAQVPASSAGGLSTQARTALAGIREEHLANAFSDDGVTVVTPKNHRSSKQHVPSSPPGSPKHKSSQTSGPKGPTSKSAPHTPTPHPVRW